ncbi:glycosyltransferase [Lachnoclostridium sp. An181]|uniref:glycosyltransferase n=1 Tax=Lachnoclostridium sp. An181 TaxID=1965575 RepID=UPI000B3A6705|nr:glycosyltransferase [Lachnoclostridium sp. An181]OUP49861.1 glycosyl transferase family 1 [Lachnoclostridium sp. An181]
MVMQEESLKKEGVEVTLDPKDDYDIVHLNTVFPSDYRMAKRARKEGKKVVYHAHSTKEDFANSFTGSNLAAPFFGKWIQKCYEMGDMILTPTQYSKHLLKSYGIEKPIQVISNGVDTTQFRKNMCDRETFREKYGYGPNDKIVMSVGLYFERKGILDFVEMAKRMPQYQFIWFGFTPDYQIPKKIKEAVHTKLPNLRFTGYLPKEELKMAYNSCDLFFFPSYEETEGIVVLEALASEIPVLLRNIPVYEGWLENGKDVYKGENNKEFMKLIEEILEHKLPNLTESGLLRARERDVSCQAKLLNKCYKIVCA